MIFSPIAGPLPVLTQRFGARPEYYNKYGLKGHNGSDYRAAAGTPIYASCEGYIQNIDNGKNGYGKHSIITSLPYNTDGTCREITFAHFSRFIDRLQGKYVHQGDLIGYSGQSGDTQGPHLHLGYRKIQNGKILDVENGFHGFINIDPYIVPLILPPLFI